jgi:maleylacetate reductase
MASNTSEQSMSIEAFTARSFEQSVVFGRPHLEVVPEMIERLGVRRAAVVTTAGHRAVGERVLAALVERGGGLLPMARMHTPVEVTEAALGELPDGDGIVSIGGGSAVGLGKALALRTGRKHIAIPTTYAGSEMTPTLGETQNGKKTTRRDARIVPQGVIYDVALTLGLPVETSMASGLNAVAHAVEALYAPDRNRLTVIAAAEAVRAMIGALRGVHSRPDDIEARTQALYGAWLAGQSLAATTMGLHHKLAHVLGGMFDLDHARLHAALLPHVVAFNAVAAGQQLAVLAEILGREDIGAGLAELTQGLGLSVSLASLGVDADAIGPVVEAVLGGEFVNPLVVTRQSLTALLGGAVAGRVAEWK